MVIGAQVKQKELCILNFKPTIYDRQFNLYDFSRPRAPYGAIAGEGVKCEVKCLVVWLILFYLSYFCKLDISYGLSFSSITLLF